MRLTPYDIIVIGAGISGATLAERYANVLGKKVLVIEKRNHIGGNCYDYYNTDGILISKYGAHLFHTNFEDVWKYVQTFSSWYPYEHHVLARVDGKLVSIPVCISTVNMLLGLNLQTEEEMKHWLKKNQIPFAEPKNSEEVALSRVGKVLYEKLFKHYTKKQWDKYPSELSPEVLSRIPVRTSFDGRYFSDKFQGQPTEGFTKLFEHMLQNKNITVLLDTDYFSIKNALSSFEKLFYTGPIDQFFGYSREKLEYRSLRFEQETHDKEFYQENSVINYPNDEKFTRIVEYKHITRQKHPKTTIVKEYSSAEGEPFYPVPSPRNKALYETYRKKAEKLESKGIYFVGRLANYKYFNMDQAFKNALDLFYRLTNLEYNTSI